MKTKPPAATNTAATNTAATNTAALRRHAEGQLRTRQKQQNSAVKNQKSAADPQRTLHELQVHQIELEMQNAELQAARDRLEALLENYTDLYDFAPVGYFSLDEQGMIMEVNLTGAALLGVERSRLIERRFPTFVGLTSRPIFSAFLGKVFAGTGKQVCEVSLRNDAGGIFWADLQAVSALAQDETRKWCRLAVSDITVVKRATEAQRRVAALAITNQEMKREIVRRQAVEKTLQQSEQHQRDLLAESRHLQEQLRHLSRQVLHVQEEERRHISRELHDVIAQTLTGINIRLATLKKEAGLDPKSFDRNLALTQKLVEKSVDTVHRFARDLRPALLDDLGLIPALHSFMKNFTTRTGVRTHLTAFAGVENLDTSRRTVLYRVAQEALTNVGRHAKANRVQVTLQKMPAGINMIISDDGKSFGVEETLRANSGKQLGLLGMRERLEMVGGQFGIKSEPGQGTTIVAQIPSPKKRGGGGKYRR